MRTYRALEITIFALLLACVGCCHHRPATSTVVVAPNGLPGAYGHVGDVLEWTTLEPDGPGFTVTFLDVSPCPSVTDKSDSFHVSPGETKKCTITGTQGTGTASFTYSILLDDDSVTHSPEGKHKGSSGKYGRPDSVVPCRICGTPALAPSGPASPRETVPNSASTAATAALFPPPDATHITCDDSQTTVDPASLTQDGSGQPFIWWDAPADWTATFTSPSPCKGGITQFSSAGPTRCVLDPKTVPSTVPYKYTVTLTGCASPGQGTLTITK